MKVIGYVYGGEVGEATITKYQITKKAKFLSGSKDEVKVISLQYITGTRGMETIDTSNIDSIPNGAKLGCGADN